MTLEEKLESFKRDRVGFHVSSREVAELLGKTLDRIGIRGNAGSTAHDAVMLSWEDHAEDTWVSVNFPYAHGTFCDGSRGYSGHYLKEIYEVTKEELEEYLGKAGE
jgi:hypothetical protein